MYTYGLVLEIILLVIVSLRLRSLIVMGNGTKILFLVILIALTGIIENNFYRPGYMPFAIILFNCLFDGGKRHSVPLDNLEARQ